MSKRKRQENATGRSDQPPAGEPPPAAPPAPNPPLVAVAPAAPPPVAQAPPALPAAHPPHPLYRGWGWLGDFIGKNWAVIAALLVMYKLLADHIDSKIDQRMQTLDKTVLMDRVAYDTYHEMHRYQCNSDFESVILAFDMLKRDVPDFSVLPQSTVKGMYELLITAYAKRQKFEGLSPEGIKKMADVMGGGLCGQTHYHLGLCYLATGNPDGARRNFYAAASMPYNPADTCGNSVMWAATMILITEIADPANKSADDKHGASIGKLKDFVRKYGTSTAGIKYQLDQLANDRLIDHVVAASPDAVREGLKRFKEALARKGYVNEKGEVIEVDATDKRLAPVSSTYGPFLIPFPPPAPAPPTVAPAPKAQGSGGLHIPGNMIAETSAPPLAAP